MKYELKTDISGTGNRLKKIRGHFRLNQKEFAARLGVGMSTVSEIESENIKLSYGVIMKLYEELGVNPNYVLLGRGKMFLESNDKMISELDFGDQHQTGVEMIAMMEKSPLVRAYLLATATQFFNTHEELISLDIQQKIDFRLNPKENINYGPIEKK